MRDDRLPESEPPWPQFATGVSLSDEDSGDDGADDVEPAVPEIDDCLGDNDPGVGPWIEEFAD